LISANAYALDIRLMSCKEFAIQFSFLSLTLVFVSDFNLEFYCITWLLSLSKVLVDKNIDNTIAEIHIAHFDF